MEKLTFKDYENCNTLKEIAKRQVYYQLKNYIEAYRNSNYFFADIILNCIIKLREDYKI